MIFGTARYGKTARQDGCLYALAVSTAGSAENIARQSFLLTAVETLVETGAQQPFGWAV